MKKLTPFLISLVVVFVGALFALNFLGLTEPVLYYAQFEHQNNDNAVENTDVVNDYVQFLVRNGLVTYASNLINGAVLYRVDVLGNDLAKVLITMKEGEIFWAYTDLDFNEFPTIRRSNKKPVFKVVKND